MNPWRKKNPPIAHNTRPIHTFNPTLPLTSKIYATHTPSSLRFEKRLNFSIILENYRYFTGFFRSEVKFLKHTILLKDPPPLCVWIAAAPHAMMPLSSSSPLALPCQISFKRSLKSQLVTRCTRDTHQKKDITERCIWGFKIFLFQHCIVTTIPWLIHDTQSSSI